MRLIAVFVVLVVFALSGSSGTAVHASTAPHRAAPEPPPGAAPQPAPTAAPRPSSGRAAPTPPASRADLLASRLKAAPVQVTDHELRDVPPGTAGQIRAQLSRLGVPAYVVVEPRLLPRSTDARPEQLISLLHDRLRRPGIYLVTDVEGSGTARQFGGSLPVEDAWRTARFELRYDAGVTAYVQRFVEILTAPDVARRIAQRRPAPEDTGPSRSDVRDRQEMTALGAGTAVGGIPLLVILVVYAVRQRRKAGRR